MTFLLNDPFNTFTLITWTVGCTCLWHTHSWVEPARQKLRQSKEYTGTAAHVSWAQLDNSDFGTKFFLCYISFCTEEKNSVLVSLQYKKISLSCSLVTKEHGMCGACPQMTCIDWDVQNMAANNCSLWLSVCTFKVPSRLRMILVNHPQQSLHLLEQLSASLSIPLRCGPDSTKGQQLAAKRTAQLQPYIVHNKHVLSPCSISTSGMHLT